MLRRDEIQLVGQVLFGGVQSFTRLDDFTVNRDENKIKVKGCNNCFAMSNCVYFSLDYLFQIPKLPRQCL